MIQEAQRLLNEFLLYMSPDLCRQGLFCSDNSSETHGKEMFTAGKIAWFIWLSMCTGMHELNWILVDDGFCFNLLQLKQWWQNNYFVVATVITQSVLKLHCPVVRHKTRIINNSQAPPKYSQSFSCMIFVSLKNY